MPAAVLLLFLTGCGRPGVKPVELFPEDLCANCKMAISDPTCASEIILESGEVFKFDDLGCMDSYRSEHPDLKIAAVFVKEYDTKGWLPREQAVIVETGVFTPMGSGKVAFGDSTRAVQFRREHPRGAE